MREVSTFFFRFSILHLPSSLFQLDFLLFLLLNFTLFVRPTDFLEGYEQLQIYNYVILTTLAIAGAKIANYFSSGQAFRDPITACVLGLVPAVALSHLSHFDLYSARTWTFEFIKVVLYYLLLVTVVNTTRRLRILLYGVTLFATTNATIAILDHFEIIDIPSLEAYKQFDDEGDPVTGERLSTPRLCGTGIFNDPNDLSMIAVFAMVICTMGLCDRELGPVRIAWLAPMALLFATIVLTKSRGGMLAFMAASGVLSYFRFGFWRTAAATLVCVPALLLAVGGRQTDLGSGLAGGTAQSRVELWSEGMMVMRQSPLFGIGYASYADECEGHVAHNSFVHTFVELGLLGGTLFLGAFWFTASSLWKFGRGPSAGLQVLTKDSFRNMQPFILAGVVGFAMSQFSLSRAYSVPTYLVFGAANAYSMESQRHGAPPVIDLSQRNLGALLVGSMAFLVGVNLFIRFGFR